MNCPLPNEIKLLNLLKYRVQRHMLSKHDNNYSDNLNKREQCVNSSHEKNLKDAQTANTGNMVFLSGNVTLTGACNNVIMVV